MKLTAIQKIKYDLIQAYKTHTCGKQVFVGRSMEIAYAKGLDDAFEWVKNYNEDNAKSQHLEIMADGAVALESDSASGGQ